MWPELLLTGVLAGQGVGVHAGSLRYLALGDSYTIGEGVPAAQRWPQQLAQRLRADGIDLGDPQIIATTGWTTDELSAGMDAATLVPPYDFVTLSIGVNNQYRGRDTDNYRREFAALLKPYGVAVVAGSGLGLPEPVEDGASFAANARIKAHAAAKASALPALADDSGLVVQGLDGLPGVHSARWAGPDRDFSRAMARVRDELVARHGSFERADRAAAFVAVLCLAWPDGHEELALGRVEGELVDPPRGFGGFGYDPMFVPEGLGRTFGEMTTAEKQERSHRARALRRLLAMCFEPP